MIISSKCTLPHSIYLQATLKSQARDISSPPPNAYPSMAAIDGTGSSDSALIQLRPALTCAPTSFSGIVILSFKSPPFMRGRGRYKIVS